MSRYWKSIIIFFVVMAGILIVAAIVTTPRVVGENVEKKAALIGFEDDFLALGEFTQYIKEEGRVLHPEELLKQAEQLSWVDAIDDSVTVGFVEGAYWFRLSFATQTLSSVEWVIGITHPSLARVDAYIYENEHLVAHELFGNRFPFGQRPAAHDGFIIPLKLKENSRYQLFFRAESDTLLDFPIFAQRQVRLLEGESLKSLKLGAYYGVAFIIALYNLFLFFTTRIFAYLYYVFFVISCAVFQGSVDGSGFHYGWPNFPAFNAYGLGLSALCVHLFATLFAKSFLGLTDRTDFLCRYFFVQTALCLFGIVLAFFVSQPVVLNYAAWLAIFVYPGFLFAGLIVWRRGNPFAKYFTLAWSVLCFFAVWVGVAASGLVNVPINNIWDWLRFGILLEMIILAFALAARIEVLVREDQKTRAQSQAKSDFIAKVSHELRTPINGILGMSDLMAGVLKGDTERHYNEVIRQSGEALVGVLNDILDSAKIEANKLQIESIPFDLHELTASSMGVIEAQTILHNIRAEISIDNDVPLYVKGDPQRIKQLLSNLLSNAIKFTEHGNISVHVHKQGDSILFEVSDTGIGLSRAEQDKLFQPYSQAKVSTSRKFGGTGLGLYICGCLVELMDGDIGVISEPGVGSTFWFSLPLEESQAMKNLEQSAGREITANVGSVSVLVAEDDDVSRLVIKKLLEKHGHHVVAVTNGMQAVSEVINNYDNYQLVLMDCEMPKMDGYTASEKIRIYERDNYKQRKPIVALSAHAFESYRKQCLQSGMDELVTKPISEENILLTLDKYCIS